MAIAKRVLAQQRDAALRTEAKIDFILAVLGYTCEADEAGELIFQPKIQQADFTPASRDEETPADAPTQTKRGRPKKTAPDTGEE